MKSVKRRKNNGAWLPFTLRQRKNYPFPTPIPPRSIVRVKSLSSSPLKEHAGRRFRIGFYSWMDGLDCIWLVNERGKYEQTIDHDCLQKFFDIESISKERSLYGKGKPQFGPMMK